MNPNIHNIKSKEIIKYLLNNGFTISHQKGSHIQLKKGTFKVTIPNHGDKSLNIKTIISIFKQANIDKIDFLGR